MLVSDLEVFLLVSDLEEFKELEHHWFEDNLGINIIKCVNILQGITQ